MLGDKKARAGEEDDGEWEKEAADIGVNIGMNPGGFKSKTLYLLQTKEGVIPDEEYYSDVRILNDEQRRYFEHFLFHIPAFRGPYP